METCSVEEMTAPQIEDIDKVNALEEAAQALTKLIVITDLEINGQGYQ